ncbi:hypothetical protein V3596_12115 [Roseateles sp. MS17]
MRILLLIADPFRRERLRVACRSAGHEAHGGDPLDSASVFTMAPDRVELLILDPHLLAQRGAALLSNWRRMAPGSRVVMLASPAQDLSVLRSALGPDA